MRLPSVLDPREVAGLLPRVVRLVAGAETLLTEMAALLARAEATRGEVDAVVAEVRAAVVRIDSLVALAEPSLVQAVPLLERLPQVEAMIEEEVLPALGGMGSVAGDLRALLGASRELNDLLGNVPGMGRARRKVEEARSEDPATHEEG